MPEGDTVYRVAASLHRALAGKVLTASDFRVPRFATVDLTGQTVTEVVPRGKHLLTRTDAGTTIHTHLKMEGAWHLYQPGSRWKGGPDHEIRVVLKVEDWTAVGYRLGIVELVPTARENDVVGHLGPDLLGPGWNVEKAVANLMRNPDRPVAEALLDQTNLAGIGNLYKSETLFVAGVNPEVPVGEVKDLASLVSVAQRVLSRGREHWSQTTTGNTNPGQNHFVFERSGRPCRRCGTPVKSILAGPPGAERLTYWCPRCQPGR